MSWRDQYCGIEALKGKVLTEIVNTEDQILFITEDGEQYRMYHEQDCCESVYVESIVGDLEDLIGEPIVRAEENSNLFDMIRDADKEAENSDESHTWTFYKLATRKGYVDIRWYGTSNGYYSESVSFVKDSN